MSESDQRKRELESLRLAADCRQLASDTVDSDLHSHFLRMAEVWTDLATRRSAQMTNPRIH